MRPSLRTLGLATLGLLAGLIASSSGAKDAIAAGCKDQTPTSWDIEAAAASEPGERLVITGRVLANGSPLPGITVYVYHADAKGNYTLPGHEKEPPRLCGILRTNAKGEYRIRTSMPGGYEGYPAHVHFEIWGPRVSRQFAFVNLVVMDTGRSWTPLDLAGLTRPANRGADGVLRCTRDLLVEALPDRVDAPKPPGLGSPR